MDGKNHGPDVTRHIELDACVVSERVGLCGMQLGEERGAGIFSADDSSPVLMNSIVAFGTEGDAVFCYGGSGPGAVLSCCNIFGNADGDWSDCIWDQQGIDGNVSDAPGGDFTIDVASPCAPAHSSGCGLVGAWDVDCDAAAENASGGAIKAFFK